MKDFQELRGAVKEPSRTRITIGLAILLFSAFLTYHQFGKTEQPVPRRIVRQGLTIAEVVGLEDLRELSQLMANHAADVFPFPLQQGWPVTVDGLIDANPAVGDIDGDGDLEVVFPLTFDTFAGAFHHDGSLVEGWPQPFGGRSAALVDLDGDRTLEIFFGSGNKMRGFFHGGTPIPGWPQETPGVVFLAAPSVADLDRDGDTEIAAGTVTGPMHVWDDSGKDHPGWPQELSGPFVLSTIRAAASTGDVNGDGRPEVVVGSQNQRRLFGWDHGGNLLPGFPIAIGARLNGEAALADLDGDGELEIAFGTDSNDTDGMPRVFVLNADGSPLPGWPQPALKIINGGVAVGDLDRDGTLEIVAATNNVGLGAADFHGRVWVWNAEDGSLFPGWPQIGLSTNFNASPALGDLNGDGLPDILAVGLRNDLGSTGVWAWNADGSLVEGFPFQIVGFENVFSSPTITDLDGDGDVEIGFGTEDPFSGFRPAKMYFFDLPAPYNPLTMEWPTLSHDVQRTGRYRPPEKRRIPLRITHRQPFLSLEAPAEVLVLELTFGEEPTGAFAVTDINGREVEPIPTLEPLVEAAGRPGWVLARFPGAALAEAILDVSPGASEVILTIRAPIDSRSELFGETTLRVGTPGP